MDIEIDQIGDTSTMDDEPTVDSDSVSVAVIVPVTSKGYEGLGK